MSQSKMVYWEYEDLDRLVIKDVSRYQWPRLRWCWIKPRRLFLQNSCAFCQEPLFKNRNLWFTRCGHPFHKTCLQKWVNHPRETSFCPMCRGLMGNLEFVDGWNYQVGGNRGDTFLDVLEEIDHLCCRVCDDHFEGTSSQCLDCFSKK